LNKKGMLFAVDIYEVKLSLRHLLNTFAIRCVRLKHPNQRKLTQTDILNDLLFNLMKLNPWPPN